MDTFQTDVNKAKKLRTDLMNFLTDRENRMKNGESTGRVDANLRGGIQQMAVLVDSLHNMIEAYSADPGRYRLSQGELEKRKALVRDLEQAFNDIDEQSRAVFSPNKVANVGVNFKRGDGDAETEDTKKYE